MGQSITSLSLFLLRRWQRWKFSAAFQKALGLAARKSHEDDSHFTKDNPEA